MLNTQSRLAGTLIWASIAGFASQFLWSVFAWPAPGVLLQQLHDSPFAAFANRNQTALATVLAGGGLAVAYLLNGWRDRAERRHAIERAERRDAAVLAREAAAIAATCETAARQLVARGTTAAPIIAGLRASVAMRDHMLLAAPAFSLARLGGGASTAARSVRASVSRLVEAVEAHGRDESGPARGIATRALETSFAARDATRVFEALAKSGVPSADRLRLMPLPETADIERVLSPGDDTGRPSRLQPAA